MLPNRPPVHPADAAGHMFAIVAQPLRSILLALSALAATACAPADETVPAAASAAAPAAAEPAYDPDAVATNIVTAVANVREGEAVLISGNPRDLQLLEDLAVQVRRQGALPLVRVETDRMARRMFVDVPERYDTLTPLGLKLADDFDVLIEVEADEDPSLLADVPAARLAARARAGLPIQAALYANGVRSVYVGNGIYPTAARAEALGMAPADLARMFWSGVNADPAVLGADGRRIGALLEGAGEVHVTAANGTDLTLRITGRPVFISDGAITPEDEAQGGPATVAWLPAGELFLAPVPGTAGGTVVLDPFEYQGTKVEGLTLTFENGRMTSMGATSGLERIQADYDAAPAGRDHFGAFDIGLNPNVLIPPGSRFRSWVAAGMVSVGIGDDSWAGGSNEIPYGLYGHVAAATVTVDGNSIVENGRLMR